MNLLNAVESTGVVLKKVASTKGGEFAGACPYCGGKDRFRCWPELRGGAGSYWCRGCGKWGDTAQILIDFCGYNHRQAFKAIGKEMPINYTSKYQHPAGEMKKPVYEPRKYDFPVELWQKKAGKLVEKAHDYLLQAGNILKHLETRGLDTSAIKEFKLGWFPGEKGKNCIFRPRKAWGLPRIVKSNGKDKMLWIPRGLLIPCFKNGEIYRLRIRRPRKDITSSTDVKYYILPGSGMAPMAIATNKKAFVIVESELDGMLIARKAGSLVGVVALGAAQIKPDSDIFHYLKRALKILISLDYDNAGISAWKWWKHEFDNSKFWPVPEGKDPGEALEKGIDIKEWIKAGLPPVFTRGYDQGYQIPENLYPIEELELLLKKYPIEIIADKERSELVFDPGLRNRGIRNRVKQLFFKDEEIFYYLKLIHPDSVIHGGNFKFNINLQR